jgi:glycosyltransferase involved in cell wall biosynthesis
MIRSKGYLDLLAAIPSLRDSGLDVEVSFAGRWEAEEDKRAFAEDVANRGLGGVVTHHGHLSDRLEAKRLYLSADVFVLPTYYPTEAQPLTIIEALNAGTPVVTTRHAGIPLMVRGGVEAVFVSPRSPNEIATAVASLADTARWVAFSRSARERYVSSFGADAVYSSWLSLVERLRARDKQR